MHPVSRYICINPVEVTLVKHTNTNSHSSECAKSVSSIKKPLRHVTVEMIGECFAHTLIRFAIDNQFVPELIGHYSYLPFKITF